MPTKTKTIKLRLLNKLTGEINHYEINPDDPDALAEAEKDAKALIEEVDKFRAEIKSLASTYMEKNDFKPVDLKDGSARWVFKAPQRVAYSFLTARRFIDEDLLITSGAVSLGVTALKKLCADLVKQNALPTEFWDQMEETAERKSTKPYVQLERLK